MAATLTGRKRKRDDGLGEDVNLNTRIGGKIHHEKKLVHKACKKAKVFEIQKVVQRLKNERKKDGENTIISNYETQLSRLKTVNEDSIGNSAFRSKILKDHLLRDNEAVLSFVEEFDPQLPRFVESGSTLAKIQSRLLSSKILSAQVAASVESLRVLINPALKDQKNKNTEDIQRVPQKSNGKNSSRQSAFFEEDKKSPPSIADDSGWESGTVDMEDGIVDGASSGSDYGSSRSLGGPHLLFDFEGHPETESDEDAIGSGHEKHPVVSNGAHGRSNKVKKASSSITESTFLPSLSVGFIQGSDDSDFNEAAELKAADMPKKNRRGQRARRAIWEKKYGRHANHKKKEAEEHAGVFAKKTVKAQIPNVYNAQRRPIPRQEGAGKESNNVRETNTSWSKDDKPLHPSWEAKRKQQHKERGNIVPGQGKKIKF